MIQRKQTVYLVLGALALIVLFFFDSIWESQTAQNIGWYEPVLAILGGVIVITALVAVFMYKTRPQQEKVVGIAKLLTLLFMLILYGGLYLGDELQLATETGLDMNKLIAFVLPVLAYIFFFLAQRGILDDIALVRSMDRLR